jgi:hypothetical protein
MSRATLLVRTALLAAALALPAAAQQIGTVASSEPVLRGTPPGAATRTLNLGTPLLRDETVTSSASGRGQLLFLDQTTLSLGPNTTIILDRFVYDPDSGAGEIGLQLTEGALRFIGGALSRRQDATITTPTASIGIRGSTALVVHQGGRTFAIFVAGQRLCISSGGQSACTSRQGGVLSEDGYLGQATPEFLAQLLAQIDSLPFGGPGGGGTGGGGQGLGTGLGASGLPGGGPVSTTGEQADNLLFGDDLPLETLFDLLDPEFFDTPEIEEETGGGEFGGEGGICVIDCPEP